MAVDFFLKLDGVKGEAQDAKHKDEIDLLAWSWGLKQSGTGHVGGGGGSGKVEVRDITVTKYVDRASTTLALYCCNGKHVKSGRLTIRKAGEKPLEYLKIDFDDILISKVELGGTETSSDRITEQVSLNFKKFKVAYVKQKPDGSGEPAGEMGWDIAANVSA